LKGDECLKEVASLLQSSALRAKDFVARFGGEEFIMVLPETEMSAALKVAERCQQCLSERQLEHGSELNCAPVTISIGVGTVVPTRTDNLQDFLKLIDGRLYEAKKQGRDQIVSAPSKGSPVGAA
jgi:diguanylate cyclase (GGDEF)-like protein